MNYEKEIEQLLTPLPHKLQVRFALDCALDVKHLMVSEAIQALDVTEKWLKGEATQAEVAAAARAVYNASYAASNAAAVTAYASYDASYWAAVCATGASYATAYNASYAASNAAYWATVCAIGPYNAPQASQASHAARTAGNNRDKKLKEYYHKAKAIVSNLSELEKLVYNVEAK